MYLISRSANLTLPIRDRKVEYTKNGDVERILPAVSVQFQHAGYVPPYAQEAAAKLPNWGRGLGENEDPFTRCGALDTEVEAERQGWDEETLRLVEDALLNGPSNGVEYIIASAPRAPKPWPKYDEIVGDTAASQIVFTVDQLGLEPKAVYDYEFENEKREDVLAKLQELLDAQAEDVVEVISA